MTLFARATGVAAASALLACAAPASFAHAGEAGYLARLGVDYDYQITPDNERAALRAGYIVCDEMRAGTPREQLVASVFIAIPNATSEQAGGLVFAAHEELCPDADPDGHGI